MAASFLYLGLWVMTAWVGVKAVGEQEVPCSDDPGWACLKRGFSPAPFLVWLEGQETMTEARSRAMVAAGTYVDGGYRVHGLYFWYGLGAEHLLGSWSTM